MSNLSNGALERRVKGEFRFRCKNRNARCAYCRQPISYAAPRNHPESFEAAHKLSVKTHPHLAYEPSNFIPSHSKCNRAEQANPYDPSRNWIEADW